MTTLSRCALVFSALAGAGVGVRLFQTPELVWLIAGGSLVLITVIATNVGAGIRLALYDRESARHAPQGKPWVIQAGGQAQLPPPREYPRVEVVDDWMEVEG